MKDFKSMDKNEKISLRREYLIKTKTGMIAVFLRMLFFASIIQFIILVCLKQYLISLIILILGISLYFIYNIIDELVFFKKWLKEKDIKR